MQAKYSGYDAQKGIELYIEHKLTGTLWKIDDLMTITTSLNHFIRMTILKRSTAFSFFIAIVLYCQTSVGMAGFFDQPSADSKLSSTKNAGFGSASATGFLPVEQAFLLKAALKGSTLDLTWKIEPEHYLYRSRFRVDVLLPEHTELSEISIPRGEPVHDEFQGDVEIFRDTVQLSYGIEASKSQLQKGVVINVTFQGCAEAGLCYPPHTQEISLVPR